MKLPLCQWPPFSIQAESIPGCIFGANLLMLAQICEELSCGQAKFPRILSQNGQNDLEGQGHLPPFQYQMRVSQDACLVQIWWFQLKFMTSYYADKIKFMDRQTDGWTDGLTQETTIPLWPERSRGKKLICGKQCTHGTPSPNIAHSAWMDGTLSVSEIQYLRLQ